MVNIPIVSLDKIYIETDEKNIYFLDCTRVSGSMKLISRGKEELADQVIRIGNSINGREIILADDVIFSGEALRKSIKLFESVGIRTVGVISSICCRDAYDYFNDNLKYGVLCNYLLENGVVDQICERDFYFGIAGSGIMVDDGESLKKAPYFKPFGDPCGRASIPKEFEQSFSKNCLMRSLSLWEDACKSEDLLIGELPERIVNTNTSDSVIKVLRMEIDRI